METINNLAMATFQLVILFTVAKFISFVKFNLRDYFIIVGIIIPTMFLYYFYGSRAVLIPTFSSIIFLFFKLKYYAIVTILVTMIVMYLSNFATVGLFFNFKKIHYRSCNTLTIIYTFFFISFIISDIFGKNISKEI